MAAELDPEELEEWRTIFNLFDVDGDQSITCQELGVVLRSMGQTPNDQELKEMIKDMDEDGSGTVDFEVGFDLCNLLLCPFLVINGNYEHNDIRRRIKNVCLLSQCFK